jgi:hypothetical protein
LVATEKHGYVAGIITAAFRRHLATIGDWDRVARAIDRIDPDARREIEQATASQYVPLASHVVFIEAMGLELGEERLSEIGRDYVRGKLDLGFFAPVLRGWMRSFEGSPSGLLRVAPHLWRASFRNAGRMEVGETGPGFLTLELKSPPHLFVTSTAWHRMIHGASLGLLDGFGLVGDVELLVRGAPPMRLVIRFTWTSGPAASG